MTLEETALAWLAAGGLTILAVGAVVTAVQRVVLAGDLQAAVVLALLVLAVGGAVAVGRRDAGPETPYW